MFKVNFMAGSGYINNITDYDIQSLTNSIGANEDTTDIPLLFDDNDSLENVYQTVDCNQYQPGFSASTEDKATKDAERKMFYAVILCFVFMITEFCGGYFAGSLAIMTDAAHLMSDCISFIIGLIAIYVSKKNADAKMSFGYKRIEVLGAIVSVLGIWILTVVLLFISVGRIITNDFDIEANTMMAISGIGIIINIAMGLILHGGSLFSHNHSHSPGGMHSHSHSHSHSHHSHSYGELQLHDDTESGNGAVRHSSRRKSPEEGAAENLNLRAAVIHVLGDFIQSVGVFLSALLIKFYPSAKLADPLCTILFSIIVIFTTIKIFKESMLIILDAVPTAVPLHQLKTDLELIEGVKSAHHLNVWGHTINHNIMMVHLVTEIYADGPVIVEKAAALAKEDYNIKHSTIQIERLPIRDTS